jgi:hypothetical protein
VKIFGVLSDTIQYIYYRQQEHHFGINNVTLAAQLKLRRVRDHRIQDRVVVHVHNRTSKNTDELELVYTVHVGGKPVLAVAAAEDMKLVSNTEVTAELGYPVITKAERKYYTVNYKCIFILLAVEANMSNIISIIT